MHPDFSSFLDHLAIVRRSPLTVRRCADVLRDIGAFTDGAAPAELTKETLRRFAAAPCQDGKERLPAGVNVRIAALRAAYEYSATERGYAGNPALEVACIGEARQSPKYLTLAEVHELVEHVARLTGPLAARDLALVHVFWLTGLRVSEVAGLGGHHLDLLARVLRGVSVKGGHVLDFELAEELVEILEQHPAGQRQLAAEAPVFEALTGGPLSVRAIEARFATWRLELGWTRRLHPHLLRHTFATGLLGEGVEIATVAALLGHADLRTGLRYAKVLDPAHRAAVSKLGTRIPRQLLPTPATPNEVPAGLLATPAPANDVTLIDFPCVEGRFEGVAASS